MFAKTIHLLNMEVMEGGQATQSGSYDELLTAGTAFEQLVVAHKTALTLSDPLASKNEVEHQR